MKPFWLILALVALAIARWWKGAGRIGRSMIAMLAIVFVLIGVGVIHLPSVETIVEDVGGRLGSWTYLLVGVNAFLETGAFLGFIAPGETMVLFGGVLAGAGTIELVPLIGIVWACCVAGDFTSYAIGRKYGRSFLLRYGERVKIGEPQIQFVERFFERHGDLTVLLGRWIGVVRPLVPFLAGSTRLPFVRFAAVDVVASFLWSAALCVLGSVFYRNFEQLTSVVGQALIGLGVIVIGGGALAFAIATRRSERRSAIVEEWIAEQTEGHRVAGRPAAALWALITRIEPAFPGRKAQRAESATAATVSEDDVAAGGSPPERDHPDA